MFEFSPRSGNEQKNQYEQRLQRKRDNQRIEIRHYHKTQLLKRNREKLVKQLNLQISTRLYHINCVENISLILKNHRHSDYSVLQKPLHQSLIYATSKECDHIFQMFTEEVIEALVSILERAALQRQNVTSPESDKRFRVVKYALWILSNYCASSCVQSTLECFYRLISILKQYLGADSGLLRELALLALGNLIDVSTYRECIIRQCVADVVQQIPRLEPQALTFFVSRLFEDYHINREYALVIESRTQKNLPEIVNPAYLLLDFIVGKFKEESASVDCIGFGLQAVGCLLDVDDNILLLLNDHRGYIQQLIDWALMEVVAQPHLRPSGQNLQFLGFLKVLIQDVVQKLYNFDPQESVSEQYGSAILKLTETHVIKLFWKYENMLERCTSPESRALVLKLTQGLYELMQQVCCCCDNSYALVYQHKQLIICLRNAVQSGIDYKIKSSALLALCGLVQCSVQTEIRTLVQRDSILKLLSKKLYAYEDPTLNFSILKCLIQIFQIGGYIKEEQELHRNLYFQQFIHYEGMKGLNQLQTSNNEQISKLACQILEIYKEEYEYLYADNL